MTVDLPTAAPVDEFTRARLRHLIADRFGDFETLDLHLDLLDARGTWYAERAMDAWPATQGESFFGVVNHVVATQIPGPAPTPNIEAWLEAGRPTHDRCLAEIWDEANGLARSGGFDVPAHDRGSDPVSADVVAAAQTLDRVLDGWPAEHVVGFLRTYINLKIVLRRRNIVLPPVGT